MKYRNPIITGFAPDPSICRVGEDYYLVSSSFEFFPGVPVYHSRDLIHWRLINYCLSRPGQLPLHKEPANGGIWAPTIRYHDGLFYMITTNHNVKKNLIVTAEDPAGRWSDPVWIDLENIDPSLLFDDNGSVYFSCMHSQAGIGQAKIDVRTGELLEPFELVWSGTGGMCPEGPHLYQIGGRYYMMIAEGGTGPGHMETIARSDSPRGPWEPCPHNPILTQRERFAHPVQCTGHGDLIEDHKGNWWIVFLGVRNQDKPYLGRETYLLPVEWKDGWPVAAGNGRVELEIETARGLDEHPWEPEPVRDDFDAETLGVEWNFIRTPDDVWWSLTERPGHLRLHGKAVTLSDVDNPAAIVRRLRHHETRIETGMEFAPITDSQEAGLTLFVNDRHHSEIAVTRIEGRRFVIVRRRIGDLQAVVAQESIDSDTVRLRIMTGQEICTFAYALPGGDFRELAAMDSSVVVWGVQFTGPYVGLYATANGRASSTTADFDWCDYQPL